MVIAHIRNSTVRRSIVVLLTPFALIIYMAFGATMYVTHCVDDIVDAWNGPHQ